MAKSKIKIPTAFDQRPDATGPARADIKSMADADLIEAYRRHGTVKAAGAALGVAPQALHKRIQKYNIATRADLFKPAEINRLKTEYVFYANGGRLDELAEKMGRDKQNLCRKARQLGLTDKCRKRPYCVEPQRKRQKEWLATHAHPKGATGIKFAPEAIAKISARSRKYWAEITEDQREVRAMRTAQTIAKNGVPHRPHTTWKASWQEIGGVRRFYRSRWEANYARYLEWLKSGGHIRNWEHEPETFWFGGIRRGCVSYLPDFRVTENSGAIVYHEVKGWMDDRSKTKIARMAKYHPTVKLIVIAGKQYKAIAAKVAKLVPGWEAEAIPPSVQKVMTARAARAA